MFPNEFSKMIIEKNAFYFIFNYHFYALQKMILDHFNIIHLIFNYSLKAVSP